MSVHHTKALFTLHYEKYPKAQPRDFYKLIYQSVFGVGHIISDSAKDYLIEEAHRVDLSEYPNRLLVESISSDGSMVRVYLRPFMRRKLSLDRLFWVMQRSVKRESDAEKFMDLWQVLIEMVESGEIPLNHDEFDEITKTIESEGLKPMHHTEPYRDAYYPAYRVVWKPYLDGEFGPL
jgi:hypothetical protein